MIAIPRLDLPYTLVQMSQLTLFRGPCPCEGAEDPPDHGHDHDRALQLHGQPDPKQKE